MKEEKWFEAWFDTSYYHTLYQHRNEEEAKAFILSLIQYLDLPLGARCLDLACGKGRHAKVINECGFEVLGADLSSNSITLANQHAKDGLSFCVHDMRETINGESFDAIFNLFTSFGYFDDNNENLKVLKSMKKMLRPGGKIVIDFLNASKVIANLVKSEVKTIDNITFNITRWSDNKHIFKQIEFQDAGKDYTFTERVQALHFNDFKNLFDAADLHIEAAFGNYDLATYAASESDRLIIIGSL